jgi:hypothetical protein
MEQDMVNIFCMPHDPCSLPLKICLEGEGLGDPPRSCRHQGTNTVPTGDLASSVVATPTPFIS